MIQGFLQRTLIMLLVAALIACGSDGVDIGPTIVDLGEQPPLLETADPDPQVTFQLDRQQVIDSFRALVEVTGDGGGTGDELRRLADLELDRSTGFSIRGEGDRRTSRQFQTYPDRQLRRANKKEFNVSGELMPFRFARVESNDVYVDIQ